jgi:DNA-binding transcriptional MerR regulator
MARVTADPLMPIGELARRADVPVRTLRRWSDSGIVPPAQRTDAGYRMYGERERLRLETVKAMRSLGFDLDEIGAVLATHDEFGTGLAAQLDAVRTRMADLEHFALVLEAALERCDEPTAVHLARLQTLARLSSGAASGGHADHAGAAEALAGGPGLPELAEHPTLEQLDAWLELAALLAEETVDVTGGTAEQSPDLLVVLHDAMEARTSGVTPDDPRADALVDRLLAHAGGRGPDGRLPHRLLDRATPGGDLRTRRYWRLVARIKGWPEQSAQAQAVDWLAAALRVRCG